MKWSSQGTTLNASDLNNTQENTPIRADQDQGGPFQQHYVTSLSQG